MLRHSAPSYYFRKVPPIYDAAGLYYHLGQPETLPGSFLTSQSNYARLL